MLRTSQSGVHAPGGSPLQLDPPGPRWPMHIVKKLSFEIGRSPTPRDPSMVPSLAS